MEKILVVNCGSSSLKYEVYGMPDETSLGKGLIERIGEPQGFLDQRSPAGELSRKDKIADHKEAFTLLAQALTDPEKGIIKDIKEIVAVGHRVVHGGEKYSASVIIDDAVLKAIEENIELAPLHNPPNLIGIRAAMEMLPGRPQAAVFDTAFHQTLPPAAYLYALPREIYDTYRIRRYGFHGTSHRYVAAEAVKLLKRSPENTNLITCHLGNGASITAIRQGKSIDTSMGFTPLEGLVMGTRSGDIDPAILLYLLERGYSVSDLNSMLNKKGGLLGLSGISNDLRDIEGAADSGNEHAIEALDVYVHRIRQYIGAYAANMVKVDVLVFTGGVGQHSVSMRERICFCLESLGIVLDKQKNIENGSKTGIISCEYSPTEILVIPTNEELQIAKDAFALMNGEDPSSI